MKPGIGWRPAFAGRSGPRRLLGILCAAIVFLAAPGCGQGDPLDTRVDAGSYLAYSMWRSQADRFLTPRQVQDLDKAVQEIRFHVMAGGGATGSEAVEEAMLKVIDGESVRHALQTGLGWELQRAETERATLEDAMRLNGQMRTRPGDSESAAYLSDLHERQLVRLRAATDEVNRVRERLAATGLPMSLVAAVPTPAR